MAVVAGDAVSSLSTEEFLRRADESCRNPDDPNSSPVIPNGYNRIAGLGFFSLDECVFDLTLFQNGSAKRMRIC